MKVDLPASSSSTCLAVFPDGRFHMEQISQWPASDPRIFEDTLPYENLKSLSTILEAPDLKKLKTVESRSGEISQGEIVQAIIPRAETTQKVLVIGLEGSGRQVFKPLPESLRPLVQWLQATTKALNQQKLRTLKNTKPVTCWIGR
jgi:hypothetical protein